MSWITSWCLQYLSYSHILLTCYPDDCSWPLKSANHNHYLLRWRLFYKEFIHTISQLNLSVLAYRVHKLCYQDNYNGNRNQPIIAIIWSGGDYVVLKYKYTIVYHHSAHYWRNIHPPFWQNLYLNAPSTLIPTPKGALDYVRGQKKNDMNLNKP